MSATVREGEAREDVVPTREAQEDVVPARDKSGHLLDTSRQRPARAAFLASFRYAGAGVFFLFRTQRNARVHLAAAVFFTLLAIWLSLTATQLAILWVTMTVVLVTEAINTAIEAAVDLATDRYHPLAKVAKDTAAGAVLLAAIGSVVVGIALFLPPLLIRLALLLSR